MGAPFRFDRTFEFAVTAEELWDVLADTTSYPRIWSWLDDFQASALVSGGRATFRVRPPLPYSLGFVVTIDDVERAEHVHATVGGDVRGPARLVLSASATGGSRARITWELELVRPLLARLGPIGRRAMIWGHDIIVSRGIRQFVGRGLGG